MAKKNSKLCKCCKTELEYLVLDKLGIGVYSDVILEYMQKCPNCGVIKEHILAGMTLIGNYKTHKPRKKRIETQLQHGQNRPSVLWLRGRESNDNKSVD